MSISLLAANLPIPTGPNAHYTLPSASSPTPNSPNTPQVLPADSSALLWKLGNAATRGDIATAYGSGFGVLWGFGLSASGLLVTVGAGQAMIYGLVDMPSGGTITVPNNTARVYLWLKYQVVSSTPSVSLTYTTTTAPPSTTPTAGTGVFLGSCVTSGGSVTSFDTSGVVSLAGAIPMRSTADVGQPGDSPSANTVFITQTLAGNYLWDGSKYVRLGGPVVANKDHFRSGDSGYVPLDHQLLMFDSLTVETGATLTVAGRLRITP